jgi:hypothetical protein
MFNSYIRLASLTEPTVTWNPKEFHQFVVKNLIKLGEKSAHGESVMFGPK